MKAEDLEEHIKNPDFIELLSRQLQNLTLFNVREQDLSGQEDQFTISIDASKFKRYVGGSGEKILKCLKSISKIPDMDVNGITTHGTQHFDRFIQQYDKQADKSNIRITMPCCTSQECAVRIFYEVVANNGKLTEKHKEIITERKKANTETEQIVHSCAVCGKKDNLKSCSGCKSVTYCSRECQKKDWQEHKKTCLFKKK